MRGNFLCGEVIFSLICVRIRAESSMDFVTVCNHCGKTIERDFLYCPWCGIENAEPDDKTVMEHVFTQLESKQTNDRLSRVKKIETKIAEIEQSLKELGIGN